MAPPHARARGRPRNPGGARPGAPAAAAPPGHVRASPCVRARRAGGGQSGAAAHLVPGEPLAPASPQTRGPDTQTLIDRRAQPRAARARRRPAAQRECERPPRGRVGAAPPPLPFLPPVAPQPRYSLPAPPRPAGSAGARAGAGTPFSIPGNQVHGNPTPLVRGTVPLAQRVPRAKGASPRAITLRQRQCYHRSPPFHGRGN